MDRNAILLNTCEVPTMVALRKESVDRNAHAPPEEHKANTVALRKESVDRNVGLYFFFFDVSLSLSARRAWIEIQTAAIDKSGKNGRSPQGERG